MVSIWEQAQVKQQQRRGRGRARARAGTIDAGQYLAELVALGERFHIRDAKDNNTTAVGLAQLGNGDPELFLSLKGPPNPGNDRVFLAAQELELGLASSDDVHIIGNTSGLHSEMAIVRAATGGDRAMLGIEEFWIEIACIGKGVCPDCSGFMLKHNIPHTLTRQKLASDWVNPFTGAHFTGSGNDLQYVKGGQTFSATTKPVVYTKGWAMDVG